MIASYSSNKNISDFNSSSVTPPLTSFSEGTHTLSDSWISWGTLSWGWM